MDVIISQNCCQTQPEQSVVKDSLLTWYQCVIGWKGAVDSHTVCLNRLMYDVMCPLILRIL